MQPALSAFDAKRRLSPSLVTLLGRGFIRSSVALSADASVEPRNSWALEVYPPILLSRLAPLQMAHVERDRRKLLNRLKRIKGQVEAIERAVEGDKECARVLQQATACRGALEGFIAEVLEDHIREHLVDPSAPADSQTRVAADELIDIVHSYLT